YLIEGLNGSVAAAADERGFVTPDSLFKYVYNEIMSLPSKSRPTQTPVRKTEQSGDIILAYYPQFKRLKETQLVAKDIESIIQNGLHYIEKGEFTQALDYYTDVIKKYPNNLEGWIYKGLSLGYMGRFEDAIRHFDTFIMIDPTNAIVWED